MNARRRSRHNRRGVLLVEASIVYSIALMLTLGTIIVGMGVFRYTQLASLARNGTRWASVHGPTYQSELGKSAPTGADVLAAIKPQMVCMDTTQLTCTLTMNSGVATVTLSYRWVPEAYLPAVTMVSTSSAPISY